MSPFRSVGLTVWFTGLPCSGKTTIAEKLVERWAKGSYPHEHLDGDVMRAKFPGSGFTKIERDKHLMRVGYICELLTKHGVVVAASFVSPYQDQRDKIRESVGEFFEVFVDTPLEVCIERDVKGMYKKAQAGEIKNFTGIDDPYEAPENPDLTITTVDKTVDDAVDIVFNAVKQRLRSLGGNY